MDSLMLAHVKEEVTSGSESQKKQMLYQQEGKRLVSVYPKDLPELNRLLSSKLRRFGVRLD